MILSVTAFSLLLYSLKSDAHLPAKILSDPKLSLESKENLLKFDLLNTALWSSISHSFEDNFESKILACYISYHFRKSKSLEMKFQFASLMRFNPSAFRHLRNELAFFQIQIEEHEKKNPRIFIPSMTKANYIGGLIWRMRE